MAESSDVRFSDSKTTKASEADSLDSAATLPKLSFGKDLNQVWSIKLDGTNFLVWKTHVLPIIKGHKLEGFITGTKPCLPQFIVDGDKSTLNPDFEDWVATDQLVFGWLLNTMTLEVSSQMVSVSTAAGLWEAAKQLAGSQTKSRILMLKSDLQRTRKGTLRMTEYLSKMKNISEQLAICRLSLLSSRPVHSSISWINSQE